MSYSSIISIQNHDSTDCQGILDFTFIILIILNVCFSTAFVILKRIWLKNKLLNGSSVIRIFAFTFGIPFLYVTIISMINIFIDFALPFYSTISCSTITLFEIFYVIICDVHLLICIKTEYFTLKLIEKIDKSEINYKENIIIETKTVAMDSLALFTIIQIQMLMKLTELESLYFASVVYIWICLNTNFQCMLASKLDFNCKYLNFNTFNFEIIKHSFKSSILKRYH